MVVIVPVPMPMPGLMLMFVLVAVVMPLVTHGSPRRPRAQKPRRRERRTESIIDVYDRHT